MGQDLRKGREISTFKHGFEYMAKLLSSILFHNLHIWTSFYCFASLCRNEYTLFSKHTLCHWLFIDALQEWDWFLDVAFHSKPLYSVWNHSNYWYIASDITYFSEMLNKYRISQQVRRSSQKVTLRLKRLLLLVIN